MVGVALGRGTGRGTGAAAMSCQDPSTQKAQTPMSTGKGCRQPLGLWDSRILLNTGLLWAFPLRQRPEAKRRGGSDASDFKSQLQRG